MLPSSLVSIDTPALYDAHDSRACHEEGSDVYESIGYASAGNQYVTTYNIERNLFIGEIVQSTSYQGFPVVRSEEDRTIVGFVNKVELRYALGKLSGTEILTSADTGR